MAPLIALVGCETVEDVGNLLTGSVSGLRPQGEETEDRRQASQTPEPARERDGAAEPILPLTSLPRKEGGQPGPGSTSGDRQSPTPPVESDPIVAVQVAPLPSAPAQDASSETILDRDSDDRSSASETVDQQQTPQSPEVESEPTGAAQPIAPPTPLAPADVDEDRSESGSSDQTEAPPPPEIESEPTVAAQPISPPTPLAPSDGGADASASETGEQQQATAADDESQTPQFPAAAGDATQPTQTATTSAGLERTEGFVIPASIIDGDTFRLADKRIRLHGIDAPELDQVCQVNGQTIACGQISRDVLGDLTVGALVQCDLLEVDAEGRNISRCFADGLDISSAMVRSGHAVAYREASSDYVAAEVSAQSKKSGLWQGTFQMPWEWRASEGQNTP